MKTVALLLVLLLGSATAHAQKSCALLGAELNASTPVFALRQLTTNGCLGGDRDENSYTERVRTLFDTAAKVEGVQRPKIKDVALLSDEERRGLAVQVLRAVDDYLASVQSAANAADTEEIKALRAAVQQAIDDRDQGRDAQTSKFLRKDYWEWDGAQDPPMLGDTQINVNAMFARARCTEAPSGAACAGARGASQGLVRGLRLAQLAFAWDQYAAIREAELRARVRDARWRSYFADARSQYPWEMWLNSWRYEETLRKDKGISGPPSWQWIALHPDVALQYVHSAAPGDRLKPALILELVGYNFWKWGSDNKPQNAWGASLVRSYADTASVPSGAWGVAIHANSKYTLTVTDAGNGKAGVLLSIDLAGAVMKASEEWQDRFRIGK